MGKELELNVVILPEEKIKDAAIDISRKLRENFQVDFVLDGKTKHPHMTVYQARFPEKNLDAVRAYLKTVAGRMAPFEMALAKFSAGRGFLHWNAELTNEFLHLHKSVVYQLNPLRENLAVKFYEKGPWDMSETYSIQNYGSILVDGFHPPHITISHMPHEQDAQKALQELRPRIAKFIVTKVHIGTLSEYGTVTEILEEFPFGGGSPYMLKPQNYF